MNRISCNLLGTMAAVLLAGSLAQAASAATTYTYTGSATAGVWNDAASWGGVGVPGAGDTAIFNSTTKFTSFDGQSVGTIIATDTDANRVRLTFDGGSSGQTFTMNNSGTTASITGDQFYLNNATVKFTDDLVIDANTADNANEFGTSTSHSDTNTTIQGSGTLAVQVQDYGWKADNDTVIDVSRLDLSGANRFRAAHINLPDLSGVEVDMGGSAQFRADFGSSSFTGLDGSLLEMDNSYQLFISTPSSGENITVASWLVGSTQLAAGTYDINAAAIGDADFSTIFKNASLMSITVAPEPTSGVLLLLGCGGLMMIGRKRRDNVGQGLPCR